MGGRLGGGTAWVGTSGAGGAGGGPARRARGGGAGAWAPFQRLVVGLLPFPVARGGATGSSDGVVPGSPLNASSAG